jgi:UTP-glucose-1-phosphate uridylyltransferase
MIKKCLFPVAGDGTRFLPATKAMAKEMMPEAPSDMAVIGRYILTPDIFDIN